MKADGPGLLRAVLGRPEDDALRLVYADWLDETGREEDAKLAAYIRADIASETAPKCSRFWDNMGCDCVVCEAAGWSQDLGRDGRYELHGFPGVQAIDRRGFAAEIRCPTADFLIHAAALFAAHPVVRVTLTDREPVDLGYGWGWHRGDPAAAPDYIPDELWHENGGELDDTRWVRANPEDCRRALNLRCVAYGRTLAGLPLRAPEPAGRAGVG
jgi:uncharacterized protein (TIGR02996 family)